MKRFPIIFLLLIITFFSKHVYSQEFTWKAAYSFNADNREFYNNYGFAQTILNSRGAIELGYALDSSQAIFTGVNVKTIHGETPIVNKLDFTLYYDLQTPLMQMKFGSFPKEKQYYPNILYTDSLDYEEPNIEGFLFKYSGKNFEQILLLDWLQQVNSGADERFLVGFLGKATYKGLFVKDYMYYIHHAWDTIIGGKNIQDNMTYALYAGYDFGELHYPLDSASVEIGTVFTTQATRPNTPQQSNGIHAQACTFYKFLGVEFSYYKGEGTHLFLGDPFYRSGDYKRLNLVFAPNFTHGEKFFASNTNKQVQFYFKYCMHFIAGELNNSQQILLKVRLEK